MCKQFVEGFAIGNRKENQMELKETADGLVVKFHVDELAVEDDELAIEIDGMPILISEDPGVAIILTGFVGDPPAEGGETFANLMLDSTMELMDTKSAAFARNPETGAYALVQRVAQEGLSLDSFCEELSDFVNRLDSWRKMLEDFRPAVAAAKAVQDAQPGTEDLARNGFMQV